MCLYPVSGQISTNLSSSTTPPTALSVHPEVTRLCPPVRKRLERPKLHFPDSFAARVLGWNSVPSWVTRKVETRQKTWTPAAGCHKRQQFSKEDGHPGFPLQCLVPTPQLQGPRGYPDRGKSQVHIPVSCHCSCGCQNTLQWLRQRLPDPWPRL